MVTDPNGLPNETTAAARRQESKQASKASSISWLEEWGMDDQKRGVQV